MAGGYYYSTPIGAGMSNLAQAIAGGPKRELEAGLMQRRQALLDEQVKSEAQQTLLREAQTREHNAAAEKGYAYLQGLSELAGALKGEGGLNPPPPAEFAPTAPVAATPLSTAMTYPVSRGGPPEVPPQPLPNGGLVGAVADSPLQTLPAVAGPGALPANPLQTLPAVAGPGALPETMTMPLGGPGAPINRTGITQDLSRKVAVAAARMGMKPDELLLMFSGNNLAAQTPNDDNSLSYTALGSGKAFNATPMGARESNANRVKIAANNAAARSADSRYSTDARSGDNRYRVNTQEAGRNNRAKNRPGGKPKPLSVAQLKYMDEGLGAEAARAGIDLTPAQLAGLRADVEERMGNGDAFSDAFDDVMQDLFDVTPATEAPRTILGVEVGTKTVPEKKTLKEKPKAAAPAASKPAAAPAAAPAPVPRDKTQWKAGTSYTLGNGTVRKYLGGGQWE